MVKIARLDDAFSESFQLEPSPGEGESLQQKYKKRRNRKGEKKIDFCACPNKIVVKRDASGEKAMLSCCKCFFGYIDANLAHIQAENLQNVQEMRFWQKAPRVNGPVTTNIYRACETW